MLLKEFVCLAKESLSNVYTPEEAKSLAGIICEEYLGVKGYTHILEPDLEIDGALLPSVQDALRRLMDGEPIQYILSRAEFYGRDFKLSPDVLIPRTETESLCRAAIEAAMIIFRNRSAYGSNAAPVRVLDLCTGSGCIAWTMALNVPGCRVVGVDISQAALKVASSQLFRQQNLCPPVFVRADILNTDELSAAIGEDSRFDLVLANPPYVLESEKALMRRNVLEYEPALALFVDDDSAMVFNEKIAETAKKFLYTGGFGFVEINERLGERSEAVFRKEGFSECCILKDLNGKSRFIRFTK